MLRLRRPLPTLLIGCFLLLFGALMASAWVPAQTNARDLFQALMGALNSKQEAKLRDFLEKYATADVPVDQRLSRLKGLSDMGAPFKVVTVQRLHQGIPEHTGGPRLYACGWGIEDFPGIETMHTHNGSNGTFRAQLSIFPKSGLVVAAFINRGGESEPAPPLQAILAVAMRYAPAK